MKPRAACDRCDSYNLGHSIAKVRVPEGGLFVQVQKDARRDGMGGGFGDLILVDGDGRFLSDDDLMRGDVRCLDCGAEVQP